VTVNKREESVTQQARSRLDFRFHVSGALAARRFIYPAHAQTSCPEPGSVGAMYKFSGPQHNIQKPCLLQIGQ